MSIETKVSFARVEGAGTSTPAAPLQPAPAEQAANPAAPAASTALAAPRATGNALGFCTGDDEGSDNDPRDIRFPRLNLVQGMSGVDLKSVAPEGEFVFKRAIALPKPFKAVLIGFRPKYWLEAVKFGGKQEPRTAHSLEEVAAFGGTDNWRLSKANKGDNDTPVSSLPWFAAHVTCMLLIARPEGFDDGHFPYVADDGIAFAAALFTVKSTSFGSFFIPLNSERKGVFKGNYASRWIEISAQQNAKNPAWSPTVKITTPTSDAIIALAAKIVG